MFLKSGAVYAASSAPKITCKQWNYVSSPSPDTGDSLDGIAAISSSDVWAVGYNNYGNNPLPLAEHYDGTQWSAVSLPIPSGATGVTLTGVAAVSTNNVWAVGYYQGSGINTYTLIEQWNGTNWSIVSSPNPGGGNDDFLNGVAAVSATDIWAVGVYYGSALIEQWNGVNWNVVPSPAPNGSAELFGVSAISSTNVWAVGDTNSSTSLTEQWNGTSWNIVPSPNPPGQSAGLNNVAAVSANNVWAVGDSSNSYADEYALIEQWNGSTWNIVSSPSPSPISNLLGIATISKKNIWAVGFFENSKGIYHPLIEHWNGTQWKIIPAPKLGAVNNSLAAVARIPGTSTLWATGSYNAGTLTEYYC